MLPYQPTHPYRAYNLKGVGWDGHQLIAPSDPGGFGESLGTGLGTEGARAFMPNDLGNKIVGGWVDKLGGLAALGLNAYWPGAGTALTEVSDKIAEYLVKPTNDLIEGAIRGVVTYLPQEQADAVLAKLGADQTNLLLMAAMDVLDGYYVRVNGIGPGQSKALATALQLLNVVSMGKIEIGTITTRLADKVHALAEQAGAKDYESAAAAARTLLALQLEGAPSLAGQVTGGKKLIISASLDTWLGIVGPAPIQRTVPWLDAAFAKKSGKPPSGIGSGGLAIGAGLLLAMFLAQK